MKKEFIITPNDPKLSDGRLGRDACSSAERTENKENEAMRDSQKARGVTEPPVRCSAWLGDGSLCRSMT